MHIISYGDKIQEGIYSLIHSVFQNVVNLNYADKYVISLVSEKVGVGPLNIVVKGVDFNQIKNVEIAPDYIKINDFHFEKNVLQIYNSKIPDLDFQNLDLNWELIAEELKNSPEKSLAFLIFPEREGQFTTTFDKVLIKKIKESVSEKIEIESLITISKSIKGIGYGLTPSGDDFIAGMLTSLNFLEIKNKNSYIELKNKIFETVLGENRISNNSFYMSKENLYSEKLKNLLVALSGKNQNEVRNTIRNYIEIGETSGADFLTGMYLTYKNIIW